ncbi:MAG: hypothetical protein AB1798_05105 [Spirochaetota bacterium]
MLDAETKGRIDSARDILVGKVPDPKSQVEQITIALKNGEGLHGMPYQTLLGSVIHKYVTGSLVDMNEARKLILNKSPMKRLK